MPQILIKLQKPLERVVVELCEQLPGHITLFEKNGLCEKPTNECKYCMPVDNKDNYFCYKKTYTPTAESNQI